MNLETHKNTRIGDYLCEENGMKGVNSSNSVNGVVKNSVEGSGNSIENWDSGSKVDKAPEAAVTISQQNVAFGGEKEGFGSKIDEVGSSGAVGNAFKTCDRQEIGERMDQNDPGSSGNSRDLVDVVVLDTIIVVNSDQTASLSSDNRGLEVKSNELGSSKALVENLNGKASKAEKESFVIDVKCGDGDGKVLKESLDAERVCRICHLSSEQSLDTAATTSSTSTMETAAKASSHSTTETAATTSSTCTTTVNLIQLGCGCKDELGIAHSHCAEAWFKLKGNRLCEICGETAKNVTGVGDCRFMEEWNERRFIGGNSSPQRVRCWRGQSFCNFLLACLVISFVLPWFFRVNMF